MSIKYEVRYASHPIDVKNYDTKRLREEYLMDTVFVENEINLVYTMYDRLIVGGAFPVSQPLSMESIDPLKAPNFLHHREIGIINVGSAGKVKVGNDEYALDHKEALYVGSGDYEVVYSSDHAAQPAKFYFNSAPAHKSYPIRKVTKANAVVLELGSSETSNARRVNRMLVREVIDSCQLQMGMTELQTGSVWNTMPAHTHSRRMEAYFYFDLPLGQAVCHFMGQPHETRHIWMKNEQAVISPAWSIHSAAATSNYTFIWGMAGENLDYNDMDSIPPDGLM